MITINPGTFLKIASLCDQGKSCLYITNVRYLAGSSLPYVSGIDLLTHIYHTTVLVYLWEIDENIVTDPEELEYWNTLYKLYLLKES